MRHAVPTGQWITEAAGRWWFDSGSVAIDFTYSGVDQSLEKWLSIRFPEVTGVATDRDLMDALALQGSLGRLVVAASRNEGGAAEDIDILNLFAATPDIPPSLDGGTRRAGRSGARVGQALSAIARGSIQLFAPENRDRIRQCSAATCEFVFYDESRSNNRRWCSMQRCGNRAKVRAHRERVATR
jgi:predicted RNA-binding Zn ribbon-like protein